MNSNVFSKLTVRQIDTFELMKAGTTLLKFTLATDITSTSVLKEHEIVGSLSLFPPAIKDNLESKLVSWLNSRFIPRNRRFMDEIMSSINQVNLVGKLKLTMGLTVIDDYWIRPEDYSKVTWEEVNLFDNSFDSAISNLAFTGFGDYKVKGLTSSPEFTTDGMLRKVWRKHEDNSIWLYKGGTEGYSNAGLEPYSEFYSNQIASILELNYVPYDLVMFREILCSICPTLSSKEYSLVPASNLWLEFNPLEVLEEVNKLSEKFFDSLLDMIMFDYIVMNTDRHLGNYGLLYDNETMNPISVAPIYDNGLSLSPYHVPEVYTIDEHENYMENRPLSLLWIGSSEYETYREFLPKRLRSKVRKLLQFEFKPHHSYNLPDRRLKLLSEIIRYRASKILGG